MHGNDYKQGSSNLNIKADSKDDPFLELLEICSLFEIKNFSVIDLEAANTSFKQAVIFTNWPMSFLENVRKFNLHLRTDLPALANSTITPFNWKFETVDGKIIDHVEELLSESDMLDGLVLPVRSATEKVYVFVFNGLHEELSSIKIGSLLFAAMKLVESHDENKITITNELKSELTSLEVEGLKLQSEGMSKSDISKRWGYSELTVNTCLAGTYKKIGASTCCHAVSIAVTSGIIV